MSLFELRQDAKHLILAVEAEDRLPLFYLPDERVSRITPSLGLQAITEFSCVEEKEQNFLDVCAVLLREAWISKSVAIDSHLYRPMNASSY